MNLYSFSLFQINQEKEKRLFNDSLVFFDTSSLLSFYFYSEDNRNDIKENVFKKLADRLWITAQTEYEFFKDRETVLLKPQAEYDALLTRFNGAKDGGHVSAIRNYIDQIESIISKDIDGQLKTLQQKTEKKDKHPFLDQSIFKSILVQKENLLSSVRAYRETYDTFESTIMMAIEQAKNKIQERLNRDDVVELFKDFFKTTKPYTYSEVLSIIKEGKLRYDNSIPPGYEDNDKNGFQIYGDLIIWKQLIRQAKESDSDVIYIINDKKPDIWQYRGKEFLNEPRHELIKEFNDETGHIIWFYTIEDFLRKANGYLSTSVKTETIDDVIEFSKEIKSLPEMNSKNLDDTPDSFDFVFSDWIKSYFLGNKDIHESQSGYGPDYIIRNCDDTRTYLYCYSIASKLYTRLLFPVRRFFLLSESVDGETRPGDRVLVLEYSDKEVADTFRSHIHKGDLKKLLTNTSSSRRVIAILRGENRMNILFDSEFPSL